MIYIYTSINFPKGNILKVYIKIKSESSIFKLNSKRYDVINWLNKNLKRHFV